jgi:hypothetical protein
MLTLLCLLLIGYLLLMETPFCLMMLMSTATSLVVLRLQVGWDNPLCRYAAPRKKLSQCRWAGRVVSSGPTRSRRAANETSRVPANLSFFLYKIISLPVEPLDLTEALDWRYGRPSSQHHHAAYLSEMLRELLAAAERMLFMLGVEVASSRWGAASSRLERCPQLKFAESRTLDVDNKFGIQRRKIRACTLV